MGVGEVVSMVAAEVVREVFARLDNEWDAKGELLMRAETILAELNRTDLPDRAAAALTAREEAQERIRKAALDQAAGTAPTSTPPRQEQIRQAYLEERVWPGKDTKA